MKIVRNGNEYELTPQELTEAFSEQKNIYLKSDAEQKLREYFNIENEETDLAEVKYFEERIGVPFAKALDEQSEEYLLDAMVATYQRRKTMNCSENEIWYELIAEMIDDYGDRKYNAEDD